MTATAIRTWTTAATNDWPASQVDGMTKYSNPALRHRNFEHAVPEFARLCKMNIDSWIDQEGLIVLLCHIFARWQQGHPAIATRASGQPNAQGCDWRHGMSFRSDRRIRQVDIPGIGEAARSTRICRFSTRNGRAAAERAPNFGDASKGKASMDPCAWLANGRHVAVVRRRSAISSYKRFPRRERLRGS